MKISLSNIGVFKQAEYELGDLTIICGENNTGKTYATYLLYGFYDFWKNAYLLKVPENEISKLMDTGSMKISLTEYLNHPNEELQKACKNYSRLLPMMLAAQKRYFINSDFSISMNNQEIVPLETYNAKWRSTKGEILQISKESESDEITVSLLIETQDIDTMSIRNNIINTISLALKKIIYSNTISDIFIASSERTGAVIFKNELNLERNIILKEVAGNDELDLAEILQKAYLSSYALPVRRNIDFIRKLEDYNKEDSVITKKYPDLLLDFADILGGDYKVGREGLYFLPKSTKSIKLSMGESSSSVRSLLDIGFYLRHLAEEGDMLMVDEPELNLHPSNQRRLAKLFARLVNIGIKVFITTHSDYIIKELNTLIMFNSRKNDDSTKKIMHKYKYLESELIDPKRIKVYISERDLVKLEGKTKRTNIPTLVQADIDEFYGIEAKSFDKTINEMNEIQERIILGRE